jgi:uncharacterized membrane protein YkvA (DUF1232 family)
MLLLAFRTRGQSVADMARVFPNCLRLAAVLYRDPTMPGAVRWRLRIALIYNIQPINLIPDFIPVIGFADNVVVLAWALRGTVRIAGPDAIGRHWRGGPSGLAALYRVLRLPRAEQAVELAGGSPEQAEKGKALSSRSPSAGEAPGRQARLA